MEGCESNLTVCNLPPAGSWRQGKDPGREIPGSQHRPGQHCLHGLGVLSQTKSAEFLLQLECQGMVKMMQAGLLFMLPLLLPGMRLNALLGRGAPGNAVSHNNGCSPLHHAASKNRHEIAVVFLEGGANPDA